MTPRVWMSRGAWQLPWCPGEEQAGGVVERVAEVGVVAAGVDEAPAGDEDVGDVEDEGGGDDEAGAMWRAQGEGGDEHDADHRAIAQHQRQALARDMRQQPGEGESGHDRSRRYRQGEPTPVHAEPEEGCGKEQVRDGEGQHARLEIAGAEEISQRAATERGEKQAAVSALPRAVAQRHDEEADGARPQAGEEEGIRAIGMGAERDGHGNDREYCGDKGKLLHFLTGFISRLAVRMANLPWQWQEVAEPNERVASA